jgi:hypothetical protein
MISVPLPVFNITDQNSGCDNIRRADRHWSGNNEIVIDWFFAANIRKAQSSPCPLNKIKKTSMEIEISCKRDNPI